MGVLSHYPEEIYTCRNCDSLSWPAAAVLIMAGLNIYRFGNIFDTGYGAEQSAFTTPLLARSRRAAFFPVKISFLFSPPRYLMHPVNLPCLEKVS